MSSNPCDYGMCNPYQCHDEDCLHTDFVVTDPNQKKIAKTTLKLVKEETDGNCTEINSK